MTLIKGDFYNIRCGWGLTKAKFEYSTLLETGKTQYYWITPKGFRFCSYDLENTKELVCNTIY